MTPLNQPKIRIDIQYLRAIAVLSVVLYHTSEARMPNGYLGVDVFFVISGFVLAPSFFRIFYPSTNSNRKLLDLGSFLHRRFLRLFPALALMILITLPIIFLIAMPQDIEKSSLTAFYSLIISVNWLAPKLAGNYFTPDDNPYLHTWSLSVEEQMYIGIPLLLLILSRIRFIRSEKMTWLLAIMALLSFITFILNFTYPWDILTGATANPTIAYYSTFGRIWQFLLGVMVFLISSKSRIQASKITNLFYLIVFFALCFFLFIFRSQNRNALAIFVTLITSICLLLGASAFLNNPLSDVLIWIGNRSYSIYLYHLPILFLAKNSPLFGSTSEAKFIPIIFALVATFCLAGFSYSKIELRYWKQGQLDFDRIKQRFQIFSLVTISGVLSFTLSTGNQRSYWGLDQDNIIPPVAWDLEGDCDRMLVNEINLNPCVINHAEDENPSILLIGDSSAAQLSEAVHTITRKLNFKYSVWTQADCNFILTRLNEASVDVCTIHNNLVLNWIEKNKPSLVILSNYLDGDSNLQSIKGAIKQVIASGSEVLLLGNIPVFPDSETYMKRRPLLTQLLEPHRNTPVSFPLDKMRTLEKRISQDLIQWSIDQQIDSVTFENVFCSEAKCSRFFGGEWLYWDNHHLSIAGAQRIEKILQDYFTFKFFSQA